MTGPQSRGRCAIYTRKSSEEGLDQAFNSLHAQRDACEAYILSQKHEGWQVPPATYDDGGFSGGNMERPGLKNLLADIAAGKVDTVVVYKVDRLTRSLSDFARIVESFDSQGASFVSVTQQFNTTSSMGRLTLNVLLSFAQFEREVTGERIRDKIAASKKGMWMGGPVPLGYDLANRQLVVNEAEAETVRKVFARYLVVKSVTDLQIELERAGFRTKRRITSSGREVGGVVLSRGALYHLLSSPLYIGKTDIRASSTTACTNPSSTRKPGIAATSYSAKMGEASAEQESQVWPGAAWEVGCRGRSTLHADALGEGRASLLLLHAP